MEQPIEFLRKADETTPLAATEALMKRSDLFPCDKDGNLIEYAAHHSLNTVNIDTVAHQATLGPSTGASERLHQHAPWLIGDRTYRVGIAVVSKSAGSVPFEFHLANDVAALFVEDADVGQHVFADVAVTNPNPHEVGIALLVAGHTLVISEIQARLAP